MRTNLKILYQLLIAMLMIGSVDAAVTLKESKVDGQTVYDVANERFSIQISPARGGAVTSFKDKLDSNRELVLQKQYQGLCLDHFQSQNWPGEMLEKPYTGKVLNNTPQEIQIQVSYDVKGVHGTSLQPKIKGMKLVKTYTIRSGANALECSVSIHAPSDRSVDFAYWQQNVFFAGGSYDRDSDYSFRPSIRGVRSKCGQDFGHYGSEDFLKDYSEGWMALLDRKTKSGLVFLVDYNELRYLYCNIGNKTIESMFRVTYLPAGGIAKYLIHIVPVVGIDNVATANENIVLSQKVTSDNKSSGKITLLAVESVVTPKHLLSISLKVADTANPAREVNGGTITFGKLGRKPVMQTATFNGVGVDPLIVRGEITSKNTANRKFEFFHVGSYKWADNIMTDMKTPVYAMKKVPPVIKLQKPKNMNLRNKAHDQIWYIEGLLDNFYNMKNAIRLASFYDKVLWKRTFVAKRGGFGFELSDFTYDYEKLLSYDLIIFGGTTWTTLGYAGDEMLADYLSAGGGMIVLGGPMAYGLSGMKGSKISEFWPIEVENKPFDLIDVKGQSLIPVSGQLPIPMDFNWEALPRVKYVHQVTLKPNAKILVTVGGHPFIVAWESEKGRKPRVVCVLGTPMGQVADPGIAGKDIGAGKEDMLPFWKWHDWPYLMRNLTWWVMRSDRRFSRTQ